MSLNVVHINSYFVTNRLHSDLVYKLSQAEISQTVYIPIMEESLRDKHKIENLNNVTYIYSKCYSKFTRSIWPVKMLQTWWDFNRKIRKQKVDTIHAHSLIANGLIAYLYFLQTKTPYVVTVRNTDFSLFLKKKYFFKWIAKKILTNASTITSLSPAYKNIHLRKNLGDEFYNTIKDNIILTPNGINDFWLKREIQQKQTSNPINILFVGRMDRNKNLITLLNACKSLYDKGLDFRLDIVGTGVLFESLSSGNYDFNVTFHGQINDREQLLDFYKKANIFAVTSYTESFGIVYAEAISQGIPVIYTKEQGFDGYFENGEIGFSIDPYSSDDVADKIQEIIFNYERITKNVIVHKDKFSWTNSVNTLVSLYKKSIKK